MSIASTIARARAFQAQQFTETGTVTRSGGEPTFNPSTGAYTPATPSTIYTGPCSVRPRKILGGGRDVQVGQQEQRLNDFEARFPFNTAVKKDDVLTVTASTYDAGLVDRQFRLNDIQWDGLQVSRRTLVEEVS